MRVKSLGPVYVIACAALALTLIACRGGSQTGHLTDAQKKERLEALYQGYEKSFPTIESVTVDELVELQQGTRQVVLVDVREPQEMKVSMIPRAIDVETFQREAQTYREAIVVPYCTAGYRSGLFTQELQKGGWDVRNLEGSILAWTLAGLPLEDAQGPTKRVHVFGRTWDLASEDFSTVW
jgi:sodium/bile acid cotransporter 7